MLHIDLFCKRVLQKRPICCKRDKEPINRCRTPYHDETCHPFSCGWYFVFWTWLVCLQVASLFVFQVAGVFFFFVACLFSARPRRAPARAILLFSFCFLFFFSKSHYIHLRERPTPPLGRAPAEGFRKKKYFFLSFFFYLFFLF